MEKTFLFKAVNVKDEMKRKIHGGLKIVSSEDSTESMSEGVCMITIFHAGTCDP